MFNIFDSISKGANYLGSGQLGSDLYDKINTPEQPKEDAIQQFYNDTKITPEKKQMMSDAIGKGMPRKDAESYISKEFYGVQTPKSESGILGVGQGIMNIVGGAISEVPSVIGNTASFLNDVGQYNPASYIGGQVGDIAKSAFTDTTYSQARDQRSQQSDNLSNQLKGVGQTGKEFVQKYGAYDPNSLGASIGEVGTDIASSMIGPNKLGLKSVGFLQNAGALALEGGIAGAKYDIASKGKITPEGVAIGAGGNAIIGGAFKLGGRAAKLLTPKTAEQKVIDAVGGNIAKGVVNGKTVKIPVPQEGIITKATQPFRTADTKVLTGRALTPSYAGKTPKQMLKSVGEAEKNVKEFYSQVRLGKMKGGINSIDEAANTVVSNLDSIGGKIGESVKGAEGVFTPSTGTIENINKTLGNNVEKLSGAYKTLESFNEITKTPLNIQDAFKAKRVFQNEIGKLIKSGDAGTESYNALVKGTQELSDNIDLLVEKSIGTKQFLEYKKQYKLLKSLVSDISKSAVVEGRRAPQTFVEQIGTLQAITDGITSPLSTAKQIFAKEIGELNTRGGAWKELIKNYDKQAIELGKKIPKKLIPKIKVGSL